jgi:hypothetical protein
MTDLNVLRNRIIRTACTDDDADVAIRALTSALATMVIGCTDNREKAHAVLDRLVASIRGHIDDTARPADVTEQ